MCLLSFNEEYRRLWMFPRNIRRISPWKIAQILSLLQEQAGAKNWEGNINLQRSFCKALEVAGLKEAGEQRDPNSGGPRTYLAQLKALGLLFEGTDDKLYFTKAGDDILKGEPPLPILQKLVLRHQYPSIYAFGKNVKIDPRIKIKPFLFILKILNDQRIGYLTIDELKIPIIYGHNNECEELCIKKILNLRDGKPIVKVVEQASDLYTRRRPNPNIVKDLSNEGDIYYIANTFKNCLQAVCLIGIEKEGNQEIILPAQNAEEIIKKEIENLNRFIDMPSSDVETREEIFQRRLGAWDSTKDTRRLISTDPKISPGESIIRGMLFEYLGRNIIDDYPDSFVGKMIEGFGFSNSMVTKVITPFLSKNLDIFESTYLELSNGGDTLATDFEKATCELFKKKLKFNAVHTGQRKRPSGIGGYSDIFAISLDGIHCAIIDTKASPVYSLPSDDCAKMTSNYIPNYNELCDGANLKLEFCSYVAGGFKSINSKLKEITKTSKVFTSAIKASELLRLANMKAIDGKKQTVLRKVFCNPQELFYSDFDF